MKRSQGSILRVENIRKSFKGREVVRGVSFYLSQGEIVSLLGPNGAGKTTSFYMIVGFLFPDEGEIYLDGERITHLPMYKRARKGIGYLPQEVSIFRKMTVWENIEAPLEERGIPKEERKKKVEELLNMLDVYHLKDQLGITLSGGEKRRVEIARALALSPKFLLLDEPFAGVDPIATQEIREILFSLKKKGIGILITDHNAREMMKISDRVYILYEGRILVEGTPRRLLRSKKAKELYLGRDFSL